MDHARAAPIEFSREVTRHYYRSGCLLVLSRSVDFLTEAEASNRETPLFEQKRRNERSISLGLDVEKIIERIKAILFCLLLDHVLAVRFSELSLTSTIFC